MSPREKLLEELVLAVSDVADAEDWEQTLTRDESDGLRRAVLHLLYLLSKPQNQKEPSGPEVEAAWQVGIWIRRDPADRIEAEAILGLLNKTEPGWEIESEEDDGVFIVSVPKAFADEARERGYASRRVGEEAHIDAEWPL